MNKETLVCVRCSIELNKKEIELDEDLCFHCMKGNN